MESIVHSQSDKILTSNSLLLASSIQVEVSEAIKFTHVLIAVVLRYGIVGMYVANDLIKTIESVTTS